MLRLRTCIGILFCVGMALYACTLGNPLFWDDADWILLNPIVHSISVQNTAFLFSHDILAGIGQHSNYYRPILMLTFAFNWMIHGAHAWGYHLINTGLHIANAILIFLLLDRLLRRRVPAFFAALLFLVHPLQTEAVTYVSGRGDPLSVFFMLCGLALMMLPLSILSTRMRIWKTPIAVLCAIAAILSRETAVLFPAYVIVVLMVFVYQEPFWQSMRRAIWKALPFIICSALYALLRVTVLNFANTLNWYRGSNAYTEHISYRIWTFLEVVWTYVGIIIVPLRLHMERTVPVLTSPWHVSVLGAVGGITVLMWIIVRQWNRGDRIWFFGGIMFFIPLIPSSGIIAPINALLYEHWLYLSLWGFFTVAAVMGDRAFLAFRTRWKQWSWILLVCVGIYFGFLGIQTIQRNRIWGRPEQLYLQILQYVPSNVRVLNNLANIYAQQGDVSHAEEYLRRALTVDPNQPAPYYNLANLFRDQGRSQDAIEYYTKSLSVDPQFYYAYQNMAALFVNSHQWPDALGALIKLQQIRPQDPILYYNAALVLLQMKQVDQARTMLLRGWPYAQQGGEQYRGPYQTLLTAISQ